MAHGGAPLWGLVIDYWNNLYQSNTQEESFSTSVSLKKDSADPATSEQSLKATVTILKWRNNP